MVSKTGKYILAVAVTTASVFFITKWINPHKDSPPPLIHFCTLLSSDSIIKDSVPVPEFLGSNQWKWRDRSSLKVYFFNGDSSAWKKVLGIANEWSQHCGLNFTLTDKIGLSDIRISFRTHKGYASYVGSEADKMIYDTTMFLQDIDLALNQNKPDARRIILHEFGHALGLYHELQHPEAEIPWDTVALYSYYESEYRWPKQRTYSQVLKKISDMSLKSRFDTLSIMIYAVPPELTIGKSYKVRWPESLSPTDKQFIGSYYKKPTRP